MTTKEQERKALAQIKKIVEGLGELSYIATAFEGCFEKAEENIEYDAAFSWKGEAELAMGKAAKLELDNRDLRLAITKAKEDASGEITKLQLRIEELERKTISADDLTDCRQLVDNEAYDAERKMKAAALEIVTFAEEPGGSNFQDAVRANRAAASRWNYLLGLRGRIDKALGTRA